MLGAEPEYSVWAPSALQSSFLQQDFLSLRETLCPVLRTVLDSVLGPELRPVLVDLVLKVGG